MSKSIRVSTGPGTFAIVTGDQGVISVQNFIASDGQPIGQPVVLASSQIETFGGFSFGTTVDSDSFAVTALSSGGIEVVFTEVSVDPSNFSEEFLVGAGLDASGHHSGFMLRIDDNDGFRTASPHVANPQIYSLAGDRYAVVFETVDSIGHSTSHVAVGGPAGLYFDHPVGSRPDLITHGNGDITLTWNDSATGSTIREVLDENGLVLMARGVSHVIQVGVSDGSVLSFFDPAHDQLAVTVGGDAVASGAHSTLTFNAADHTLTWDGDSEGPVAATTVAILPNVETLGVANLADGFRPEVLKVIALDGSSTIQWFDSDNSQTWDTLIATETAAGAVKTYTSILDSGIKTVFNFDFDNSQPYSRYVDQEDPAGVLQTRSVVLDDGESWVAKFNYTGGHVVSYEVDSFDVGGHLVAQNFFNADGTILLAH